MKIKILDSPVPGTTVSTHPQTSPTKDAPTCTTPTLGKPTPVTPTQTSPAKGTGALDLKEVSTSGTSSTLTITDTDTVTPPCGGAGTTSLVDAGRGGGGETNAPANPPAAKSDSSMCRICQEGRSEEELISPCHCSGTIGKMHLSCLETWLQLMHRSSCELCKYEFPVERITQPLHRFFLNPGSNTEFANLICDISCFLILTPLLIITMFLCTRGVKYYDEHGKTWSMLAVITLLGSLVVVYMSWAVLAFLYHYRIWRTWRENTVEIRMCLDKTHKIYVTKTEPIRRPLPRPVNVVARMERGDESSHGSAGSAHRVHSGHPLLWSNHRARCQCPAMLNTREVAGCRAQRARNLMEGYFGLTLTSTCEAATAHRHRVMEVTRLEDRLEMHKMHCRHAKSKHHKKMKQRPPCTLTMGLDVPPSGILRRPYVSSVDSYGSSSSSSQDDYFRSLSETSEEDEGTTRGGAPAHATRLDVKIKDVKIKDVKVNDVKDTSSQESSVGGGFEPTLSGQGMGDVPHQP